MWDISEHIEYMRDFTQFFALPEADVYKTEVDDNKAVSFNHLEIRNLRFRYTPDMFINNRNNPDYNADNKDDAKGNNSFIHVVTPTV